MCILTTVASLLGEIPRRRRRPCRSIRCIIAAVPSPPAVPVLTDAMQYNAMEPPPDGWQSPEDRLEMKNHRKGVRGGTADEQTNKNSLQAPSVDWTMRATPL
jgi:hypothetical protein